MRTAVLSTATRVGAAGGGLGTLSASRCTTAKPLDVSVQRLIQRESFCVSLSEQPVAWSRTANTLEW